MKNSTRRTILRKTQTYDVVSFTESQYNLYKFAGLNDSENYTTVDQYSFADTNNVYVDGEDRLTTRPAMKQTTQLDNIVIQPFSVDDITDIQHANNQTFYIVNNKEVHWKYDNRWWSISYDNAFDYVTVVSYDDYYLIFTETGDVIDLKAARYDFDDDTVHTYSSNELIYIPLSEIHYGGTNNTSGEGVNVFTTSHRVRYIFSSEINTDSTDLAGVTVTITLGDQVYTPVLWDDTIKQRLCKNIGTLVSSRATEDYDYVKRNNLGIYFAWFDMRRTGSEYMHAAYSIDGIVWGTINYPSDCNSNTYKLFTYTEDGTMVYVYEYAIESNFDSTKSAGSRRTDDSKTKVYYVTLNLNVSDVNVWSTLNISLTHEEDSYVNIIPSTIVNNLTFDVQYMSQYREIETAYDACYESELSNPYRYVAMHAMEDGEFVLILPVLLRVNYWNHGTISCSSYVPSNPSNASDYHVSFTISTYGNAKPDATSSSVTVSNTEALALVTYKNGEIVSSSIYKTIDSANTTVRTAIKYQPNDDMSSIIISMYKDGAKADSVTGYQCSTYNMEMWQVVTNDMKPYYNYYTYDATVSNSTYILKAAFMPVNVTVDKEAGTKEQVEYTGLLHNRTVNNVTHIDGSLNVINFIAAIIDGADTDELRLYKSTNYSLNSNYTNALDGGYLFENPQSNLVVYIDAALELNALVVYELDEIEGEVTSKVIYQLTQIEDSVICSDRIAYSNEFFDRYDACLTPTYGDSLDNCYVLTLYYWCSGSNLYYYLYDDIYSYETKADGTYGRIDNAISIDTSGVIYFLGGDYWDNNTRQYIKNYEIYTNDFDDEWYADYSTTGTNNIIIPSYLDNFITHTFVYDNVLYQMDNKDMDTDGGILYMTEDSKVTFPDKITGTVVFSQTSLALFTQNTAYEYTYDSENDVYRLYPTKLQLGNREDYDMCVAFDGLTIYLATVFGYKSLTYEDFIQSTEQAFTDCCKDIYSIYTKFDDSPIKQCKYNYWIFLYKQNSKEVLVYDTRYDYTNYYDMQYPKWFKWTLAYCPVRMWYEGTTFFIWCDNNKLYTMNFTSNDVCDVSDGYDIPIEWFIKSQRLHFSQPAYYKHINALTILTAQASDMRYNLQLLNYHNDYDTDYSDTADYKIETVGVCVKKVNFMKTQSFQYIISNDPTDDFPKKFTISGITIKYRVTERVR